MEVCKTEERETDLRTDLRTDLGTYLGAEGMQRRTAGRRSCGARLLGWRTGQLCARESPLDACDDCEVPLPPCLVDCSVARLLVWH